MKTYREIIDAFPSQLALANLIGVRAQAISQWKGIDSIPPGRWNSLIKACKAANIKGITLQTLANIAERKLGS